MSNKVVRNERRKISPAFANGLAVSLFTVGGLAQTASMVQSLSATPQLTAFATICILAAFALHWIARAILGGMEE